MLQPGLLPRLSICISSCLLHTLTLLTPALAPTSTLPALLLVLLERLREHLHASSCSSLNLCRPPWLHLSFHVQYMAGGVGVGGFPCGSVVKNLPANAGDTGLISGPGRSSREGDGIPLQYCWLENPMHREAWQATVHVVAESDRT